MTTELVILQNELTIVKQSNQILELKNELQMVKAQKISKLENSLFSPELYEHYQKVALMMSKSEIVPTPYRGKPADIFIAMEMGYQLGFSIPQSLQDIAVINGRPCLWGDGLLALVLSHPECESIDESPILNEKGEAIGYRCIVKRKGYEKREQVFTLQDAQVAGLLRKSGPWTQYPKRMLQMRARAFALRDTFGDALRGLKSAEEVQDYIEAEIISSSPSKATQTEKLKEILGIKEVSDSNKNINALPPLSEDKDKSSGNEKAQEEDFTQITHKQLAEIINLFHEKKFTQERIKKAMDYYKVESLEDLSDSQAKEFIRNLEKS